MLFTGVFVNAQKIKVEWVSGNVTVVKKGGNITSKVKKNETIDLGDRLFLGEKALLVVSDYSKKLYEVKKKGYVSGVELSDGLLKTEDSEYQRYLAYIIKELKSHESGMKSTEKGIPGAPSRGNDFMITFPDTIILFDNEPLPVRWISSINTEMVNVQLISDKKDILLDLDLNGDLFWFNNIGTYFLVNPILSFVVYERRTDGNKLFKSKTIIKQSMIEYGDMKKILDEEFKQFLDPRLNAIAKATKLESKHFYLTALDIYKILMLDYPDDEMVKITFQAFTDRTGLE